MRIGPAEASSSSGTPNRAPELSATQATFLAGAAIQQASHASGVALEAASAAQHYAEREQFITQQAREAVQSIAARAAQEQQQQAEQVAQYEESLRAQASNIASAAQCALTNAQQREEVLRLQANQALSSMDAEAQRRIAEASSQAQQAEYARVEAENAMKDARERWRMSEIRNTEMSREVEALRAELSTVRAETLSRVSALTEQLMVARDQGFEVYPPTPLPMGTPTMFVPDEVPQSFPQPAFSPAQSPNATVSHPIAIPVAAGSGAQTPTASAQPDALPLPREGAASSAPGIQVAMTQDVQEATLPNSGLELRVDELAKLVKGLAEVVMAQNAAPQTQHNAGGAAGQSAPTQTGGAQSSSAPADIPYLHLLGNLQAAGGASAPGPPGPPSTSSSSSSSNDEGKALSASASAAKSPADEEEEVIRVKAISDLTFPSPPENAGQARGFINQALVAIGRVQRSPGNEVYIWAQDCLTKTDQELIRDQRFPRLQREIAAKLLKVCRKGRFGLLFQQMVERERIDTGGMPNGRCMLRAIFKHFQLEHDRIGMLGERNLLNIRLAGDGPHHLEAFRDKYQYVLATIPVDELPKESTMFNHLIDELDKNNALKPKIEKAREARPGSHRRTCKWLWNRVDIVLELHQQKVNRNEFDKNLQGKPEVLTSTGTRGGGNKGGDGNTTPRSEQVRRASQMSDAEKAKTPCMFYAYGACKGSPCPFLHDDNNNDNKVTWLWDTAAGRHLIGRQALSSRALACVRKTDTPVGFATGGGAREGTHSVAFEGSRILPSAEQVYVLKECPPAFSVGKAVLDEGSLFVWDPRESQPYLVPKQDVHRCRLKVPRKARINATRVVEYVPQFDEELKPTVYPSSSSLSPVVASASPAPAEDDAVSIGEIPPPEGYEPTEIGDSDEDAHIVDANALAEETREQLFGIGAEGESAAEEPSPDLPEHAIQDLLALDGSADMSKEVARVRAEAGLPPEPAPAEGAAVGAPPHAQPEEPSREEALRTEATSAKHLRTHFPKNPFCKICHVAKTTSMRIARKPDGKADDLIDVPTASFQQLATDDVILAKGDDHRGIGTGGVKSHHVIRDVFSGARIAYPMTRRGAQQHARNYRHFMGLKASELAPTCLIKMDEAGELKTAAEEVGLIPDTSLPNRWPHNAALERDVREEKECCRAIHLQSGLPYDFHTYSFPFACLSLSFDRTANTGTGVTQWEALTKEPFSGMRLCFGQLVWYRTKLSKLTLEPNMSPALFLGWRIDAGMRYRGVTRVLDYHAFRNKREVSVIDVPEPELFVEEGEPIFPLANATRKALVDGTVLEGPAARSALPDFPVREAVKHIEVCRERFAKLVSTEREEAQAKKAVSKAQAVAESLEVLGADPSLEAVADNLLEAAAESAVAPPASEEPAPSPASASSPPLIVASGAALPPSSATRTVLTEATCGYRSGVPVFGMPAPLPCFGKPRVKNKRHRKRAAKGSKLTTCFEYACSEHSMLGRVHAELGVPHVRLSENTLNVSDPVVAEQLHVQLKACPNSHLWASLPCTSGCPWHRVGLSQHGDTYRTKLRLKVKASQRLFSKFASHAETALACGADVTFEWPRNSDSWKRADVQAFFKKHPCFREVNFDGCRLGVVGQEQQPVKKPWRLMTTSDAIVKSFSGLHCNHGPKDHAKPRGKVLEKTGFYTQSMCELIAYALNPSLKRKVIPAMPVIPCTTDNEHRQKEQELKHVSSLAGLEDLAVALEGDEKAHELLTEIVDLNALICQVCDLPKSPSSAPEVNALVTKLLSRAEMLASPQALEAIRAEADGLRAVPVWDETNPREYRDVQSEARRTGAKVHFGKLMSIASIKFWELAQHLQKMKGRIVYRGDCAKDEEGAAAVYRELGANPTSVQGLNACLAYGALPGNQSSAADAIKAYVQALLKSKFQTWIELPPELRPTWWRERFVRPVVLLLRALYGHPEAGGLWEKHLKEVLQGLGGYELQEYPGNFWFPETQLLLSTYVDDLTLSGPQEHHQPFWEKLCSLVDVEPPEPVYRILGRNHYVINAPAESSENAALGALKGAVVLDMYDYAQQTVDLYTGITGTKSLKAAQTPFCPEGSLVPSDDEVTGELAPNACKILMKALWLGRLARPDIIKPIGDLATRVQSWTRNNDKQLHRLICYINSTKTHRLVGTVQDNPGELHLALYVDADFAGEKVDAKSTSGGYLVLKGPNSFFPLAWVCKRQTSTSRSTTESEIVSLAHSLFSEGLPALQLWQTLLGQDGIRLVIHEDNQATIIVAKKGYSPKLRHIQRTHKVNLGSIAEQLDQEDVELTYVDTNLQAADIFTKALPPNKWDNALKLLGIRQKLPEVLVDIRDLHLKPGSGPKTQHAQGAAAGAPCT
ncbi:RE1 [Symbiodinium natans]|uniref:RE1 protein n=1 Tax=Symbiodinium natans TaxID=878477 RepID=A0A812U817_9DINO|nr:RE1 [Symbiodinium natans]